MKRDRGNKGTITERSHKAILPVLMAAVLIAALMITTAFVLTAADDEDDVGGQAVGEAGEYFIYHDLATDTKFAYTVTNGSSKEAEVTMYVSGIKSSGHLTIPSSVMDGSGIEYTVTGIGNAITGNPIFSNTKDLKTVDLPDTIRYIGDGAFWGADLTYIVLPKGLMTIGSLAFSHCGKLEWVTVPSTLTSLNGNTFSNTPQLTALALPYGVHIDNSEDHMTSVDKIYYEWSGSATARAVGESIELTVESDQEMYEIIVSKTYNGDPLEISEYYFIWTFERTGNDEYFARPVPLPYVVTMNVTGGDDECRIQYDIDESGEWCDVIGGRTDVPVGSSVQFRAVTSSGYVFKWNGISCGPDGIVSMMPTGNTAVDGTFSSITEFSVKATGGPFMYNGSETEPQMMVSHDGEELTYGTDYVVSFNNNISAGIAHAVITFINDRTGTITVSFVIEKADGAGSITIDGWSYGTEPNEPNIIDPNGVGWTVLYKPPNGGDWTTEVPERTGTYLVKAVFNEAENYHQFVSEEQEFSVIASSGAYDPDYMVPILEPTTYDPSVTLSMITLPDGWEWADGSARPTVNNSGYYATYTPSDDGYEPVTVLLELTVTPMLLEKPVVTQTSFPYTGSTISLTVVGLDTDTMTISGNEQTSVGTYISEITLNDDMNYAWVGGGAVTIEWTITTSSGTDDPDYDPPALGSTVYDPSATLSMITLPDGWEWTDGSTIPTVNNSGYYATYTPSDDGYEP
ncbi:MAG: leucine-rich repeat domain-containing protein, partial [Methanomassiliicoccaceae archaeon]|nr:leucine-rich repeat domain-containing protein [Methanomassiliicoccaceae archaeon]